MNRDKKSRDKLIKDNMGLVYACANKFRGRGADYDDLVQSGCIGLVKAAEGFDENLGFMFSTYAVPAIIGEIKRIFRDGGSVKIGRSDKEKARNLMKMRDEMTALTGKSPTVSELAEKCGYDAERTAQLLCVSMPVLSLTADEESGENSQLDVTLGDTTEEMSDAIALKSEIEKLDERDRQIINLRYYHGLTQAVTARRLGMTQVQVSRREKNILLNLRQRLSGV